MGWGGKAGWWCGWKGGRVGILKGRETDGTSLHQVFAVLLWSLGLLRLQAPLRRPACHRTGAVLLASQIATRPKL